MNAKPNFRPLADAGKHVLVFLGSSVQQVAAMVKALSRRDGIGQMDPDSWLGFDYESGDHRLLDSHLDLEIGESFTPDEFVEAKLPADQEALKKAEEAGHLYPASDGWYLNPGSIAENMGAGGSPRYAFLLTLLTYPLIRRGLLKIFQEIKSHARQDQSVMEGMGEGRASARTPVMILFSDAGAMGSGSMVWWVGEDGIRLCANQAGIQISVNLHIIDRGGLQTKDNEKADLNRYRTLKHLHVLASGGYVAPLTGQRHPAPCDTLFLSSNENPTGSMTTFDEVLVHQARCDHFLCHTPGGAKMRSLLIDISDRQVDEYGDPRIGLTMGYTYLSRDSARLLDFCKYTAAARLAQAVRAPSDEQESRTAAIALARQLKIVESEQENQLTEAISHPAGFGAVDVAEAAKASLEDRIAGCHGIEGLVAADDSVKAILGNDVTHVYGRAMHEQAQAHAQAVQAKLDMYRRQTMKEVTGPSKCCKVLAFLKDIVQRSGQSLTEKARQLQELLQPYEQIIAEASERVGQLPRRIGPSSVANYLLKKRLFTSLRQSGRISIGYRLQMAACEIAFDDVVTPVTEMLDSQIEWVSGMDHKLLQTAQLCEARADMATAKRTVLKQSPGIEMVTPKYATGYFDGFVSKHGGEDAFASYLLRLFLQKHGDLSTLAEAPLGEYEQVLTAIAEEVFRPQIESENIQSESERIYTRTMQLRIMSRLIKRSEGSMRITGEVNAEETTWIKTANAPSPEAAEWLREMLSRVDKKSGNWEIAIQSDRDRIEIAQLRGGISLASLLARIAIPDDPEWWAKLIDHAADPGSVTIVPPNPSPRQFRRVLAKAIATGQLTANDTGGYLLNSSSGEQVVVGKDPESVEAFLQPKWEELAFVESSFNRKLIVDEDQTISALQKAKTELQSDGGHTDPRLRLIDLTAIEECLTQAQLLLPRLRRMRRAIQKRPPR